MYIGWLYHNIYYKYNNKIIYRHVKIKAVKESTENDYIGE